MEAFVGLLFLFSVTIANGKLVPLIIGGHDALDEYPYMASIGIPSHICGGSIVHKRWVLTAAHCLHKDMDYSIRVGSNNLRSDDAVIHEVDSFYLHPDYRPNKYNYDIAMMHVKTEFQFNSKIQKIDLLRRSFNKVNYPANVTGWGLIWPFEKTDILQAIELNVISQRKCIQSWKESEINITKNHICTFNKLGEGVCFGDSGGPLVADGKQIGIVSFGVPCAQGRPDVFIRVHRFIKWIDDIIVKYN